MDAATFADLEQMVHQGELFVPRHLILRVDDHLPEAGATVTLRWESDGDDVLVLHLPNGERRGVGAVGQCDLMVGGEPMVVRLSAGETQTQVEIVPRVIAPQFEVLGFDGSAVLGEPVSLRWACRQVEYLQIRIENEGLVLFDGAVAPGGQIEVLPETLGDLRVLARAASCHAHLSDRARLVRQEHCEVRPVEPEIVSFMASEKAVLGDSIWVEWQVLRAERVLLHIGGMLHEGPSVGRIEVTPEEIGILTIGLEAWSRHAEISPLARRSMTRDLRVVAPPLNVEMPITHLAAPIGTAVTFQWRIRGAKAARLEATMRDEIHELPLIGALEVDVEVHEERFRMLVTGLDGRVKSINLVVTPVIPDVFEPLEELAGLADEIPELNYLNRRSA